MLNEKTNTQIETTWNAWAETFDGGAVWAFKNYLKELEELKTLLDSENPEDVKEFTDSKPTPRAKLTWGEHLLRVPGYTQTN